MKLIKRLILLGFVVILFGNTAAIAQQSQNVFLTGYARNYTGVLLEGENDYSIIQNTFDLRFEHSKNDVYFRVNPYLYHYSDEDLELGLREAYLDLYFSKFDLRIGKQQIIWGKADGVFITDIVSPKDMREFLLPDFQEIRMGITSAKFDYYMGNNSFELVWVPVFSSTGYPDENSIWNMRPQYSVPYSFDNSNRKVDEKLENSELFAKFSHLGSLIDFELMGGYVWDDDPTMHQKRSFNPRTQTLDSLVIIPEHHRLGIAGGSFSTTISSIVLRGEGAYYTGKYFQSENPMLNEGVTEKDYLHYLVGFDYTGSDITLSTQFIQEAILDYNDQIVQDEYENTMTFLASMDFMRETLFVELFTYVGLNEGDALVRPSATYEFEDGFEILFGANLFYGDEGRFGQYDENDMVYTKVKYSF